jgi:ankyrin repeat protein
MVPFLPALLLLIGLALPALAQSDDDIAHAVQMGDLDAVEQILTYDPERIRKRDAHGFLMIHLLDYTNFDPMLALLMRHGANINATTPEGYTLLHVLIDPEFLPAALNAGANLEAQDVSGRTPLLLWMMEDEGEDMIAALLKAGANPNARDVSGRTPLDYAQDARTSALLRRYGAT